DPDVMAGLRELPDHGARLEGGNTSGYADDYPLGVHPASPGLFAFGVLEQVGVDLAKRYRQRLLVQTRLDQRPDVFEDAVAELVVVVVDLPGALGGEDDQRVLARHPFEKFVDGRIGEAQRGVVDG